MADLPVNKPPLFEEDLEDDDNEDLFVSAISAQNKKETDILAKTMETISIEKPEKGIIEDINLNDDDDIKNKDSSFQTSVTPPFFKDSDSESNSLSRATISPQSTVFKMPDENPASLTSSPTNKLKDTNYIEITVTEPKRCGEGMSSYVLYKVVTKTNLPFFRKDSFSVYRRFSDFLGLREKLAEKYLFSGRIVPPAPSKDAYNTAKVKISKEENDQTDFLEKRSAALQRFINRLGEHAILRTDPDFREFLELETELPKSTGTSALSGAGVKRLFSRVGDAVNKMTFKMEETDPLFEEKQHQIDNLDQQLKKLHGSIDALIHHRKELTVNTGQFSKSVAVLGNCEEHTSLSCALSQLSETEEKLEQLYGKQVNCDFFYLSELVKDYINLIAVVKDVFHNRVKVFQTWQQAQQSLVKKRENKAKLEFTGRTDKIQSINDEISEWQAKVQRGQEDFEKISKTIKVEFEKLEIARIKDFKKNIILYMESLLETQQQVIKYWEAFLPEARSIS